MSAVPVTWIIETLLASALLIAMALVLRRPVARLFGPHAAYLLWALPGLRFVTPTIPGAAPGPAMVGAPVIDALTGSAHQSVEVFQPTMAALPSASSSALTAALDWPAALIVLWLGGAAIHMAWQIARYRLFIGAAVGAQEPEQMYDGLPVFSADIAGPAAAGIIRRRILVPYDFADRFDVHEQRLALSHEAAHHRRGDLVANWAALLVLSLHWFNPLAHVAYRAFRADQELACDATVLEGALADDRHAYASAVVKAAWRKSPVAACPMNSTGQLKARLAMMKSGPASRPRRLAGLVVVGFAAAAALGGTASRSVAALPDGDGSAVALADAAQITPAPPELFTQVEDRATDRLVPVEPVAVSPDPRDDRAPRQAAAAPPAVTAEEQISLLPVHAAEAPADLAMAPVAVVKAVAEGGGREARAENQPSAPRRSASSTAFPPIEVLRAAAAEARTALGLRQNRIERVRDVRAVIVEGRFNAVDPGTPYIGFCGELRIAGQTVWRPFFVSATPSAASARAAKCAGPKSDVHFTGEFWPRTSWAAINAGRNSCSADQSACLPSYYSRAAATNGIYPTSDEYTRRTGLIP